MKKMKSLVNVFYALCLCSALAACSNPYANQQPTLPISWVNAASARAASGQPLKAPDAEETKAVRAAFKAHTAAVSAVTRHAKRQDSNVAPQPPPGAQKDWVPWHLDGMIAAFAVDVGGVFGGLSGDGAVGIKVTWQQQNAVPAVVAPPTKKTLRFNGRMSKKDVQKMLEPAVRAAVATKSVQNVDAFRANLNNEGQKFLTVAKVLNSLARLKGWHVAGYQLGLFFNAAGSVSATIGVGGGAALIFDWEQGDIASTQPQGFLSEEEKILLKNMTAFIESIASILPEARSNSSDLRKAGFELQVFQVGLGISAGGNVGIASVQGSAVGRVIFKKDTSPETLSPTQPPRQVDGSKKSIDIIGADGDHDVREIAIDDFRNGVSRAIDMATYFANNAVAADTDSWKVTEIEAAFDASVVGDLTLVTVGGIGLVRLGFERIN